MTHVLQFYSYICLMEINSNIKWDDNCWCPSATYLHWRVKARFASSLDFYFKKQYPNKWTICRPMTLPEEHLCYVFKIPRTAKFIICNTVKLRIKWRYYYPASFCMTFCLGRSKFFYCKIFIRWNVLSSSSYILF